MKDSWSRAGNLWCRLMHPSPMWPVNGQYRCPKCMRTYPVPWEREEPVEAGRRDIGVSRTTATASATAR